MVKVSAFIAVIALVLAGIFAVSVSLWTRQKLYSVEVSGYCIRPIDIERFGSGRLSKRRALADLVVSNGVAQSREESPPLLERVEISVVRRLGFFFVPDDAQLAYIKRLPACPPAEPSLIN